MRSSPSPRATYPGEKASVIGGQATYYGQGIIYAKGIHDVTIQGLEVSNITGDGEGIFIQDSSNIIIKNNIVHDIQHVGIDVSGDAITVDGNEIYNACLINGPGANASGGWPPALTTKQLTTGASSTNISIINNYVHDSWGEGIDAWFLNGGVIDNNRTINNYSVNLYADESKDLKITNNFMQSTNDTHNTHVGNRRPTALAIASETGATRPTNIIINGNTDGGGNSDSIVWHDNGVFPITQGPNPQDMP
jgi:parallel beta-helix repeat protein